MLNQREKDELFARLINIEHKINSLCDGGLRASHREHAAYSGHPDQAFGHMTYSQFGEDLLIANIFALLDIPAPSYLDVGAHHPLHVSNTALLYARGSRGINVEANPDLISAFRELRPDDITLNVGVGAKLGRLDFYRIDSLSGRNTFNKEVADAFVREHPNFKVSDIIQVDVLPLDEIVRKHANGVYPDFLTIDIEGLDYEVLSAADFSHTKPKAICVEAVSGADRDDSSRLHGLLAERGYRLCARTWGNLIMIDDAYAAKLRV
jgi:FkbM family methyltransferase